MPIYGNEYKTKENQNWTKDKIELQLSDILYFLHQLQGNRPSNRLTEAESLNFDPHARDLASGNQDRDMVMLWCKL